MVACAQFFCKHFKRYGFEFRVFEMNSLGVHPAYLRKVRLKLEMLLKPTCMAISETEELGLDSSILEASSIRLALV